MKTLFLILALAVSVSGQSIKEGKVITEWLFVDEGPLIKSYVAQESIRRGGDIIKVWMRFELPHGSSQLFADTPKDFGEVRIYGLIKCAQSQMQAKTMMVYDRSGEFFAAKQNVGAWTEEKPDTISHSVFLYFCERGEKPLRAPTLKP